MTQNMETKGSYRLCQINLSSAPTLLLSTLSLFGCRGKNRIETPYLSSLLKPFQMAQGLHSEHEALSTISPRF